MADGSLGTLFGRVSGGPLVVDLFAGGGGASLGIQWATGESPIVAINHNEAAIQMHRANHPDTMHFHASVFDVAPLSATRGRAVDLVWASPDCTHHSRARGGKPREKGRRALAWVVVDWARDVRPRVIALENVPEFVEWGPLNEDDKPIKARRGEEFRAWVAALEGEGYAVEWRMLVAADYGAPTSRKRLFLVARRDGQPIVWPTPTHGPGRGLAWRTAAECIDWNDPVRSIFDRPRPLAEATQRRIAEGVRRYVLDTPSPFLLCLTHGGRLEPLDAPLRTTTTANRGERALVAPTLIRYHGERRAGERARVDAVTAPLPTQTTEPRFGLASALLINTRNGERAGQAPRTRDLRRPLGTTTATGSQGALVAAFLTQHNRGAVGRDLGQPHRTVAGNVNAALSAVWLDKLHGSARAGVPIDLPHPTVSAGGGRGGGHAALCAAFLTRYFGRGGQWADLRDPMHTVTSREGFALVTVQLGGETWVLTDIGMRMLRPRELARAQGFPDDYVLTGNIGEQVERIGNSVVPQLAEAIVRANLGGVS